MGRFPSGLVTLLFTDIEGSTRLLHELGEEPYAEALAEHRRVLRAAFAANDGVEVDTQGDAFLVAFSGATGAVAAAAAAQEALADGQVKVRMGLHTGTPQVSGEGYVGEDVHLGARVAASGHGGQVLLSKATRDLIDGLELRDLGEHRVKDFDRPVWIFQLGDGAFPPLKTISNTNLPRPASSFVGREREVDEVTALLRAGARMVTLTGPGGSGKTRLSIEAGAELVGESRNGTFWVGLATVRDPQLVLPAIAQTLGAHEELAAHIGEKELLLVLDNLEHVIDVAPDLAALVEACPNLRLLVTSRELLRVRAEVEFEVLPLAEPDAVELFCARAGLQPSPAVPELCRRLDNMPLALELAAARSKALSPEQILERLGERLDLFKGGRDADPRQQTLRATIEWSYELLEPDERQLFARLAVFAGCTLDAAEAVCDAELDTLQSLVEKSLVRHTGDRFWMLETIREFSVERLEESGETETMRRRHAEFLLALAELANLTVERVEDGERHELVTAEADNLRAALDWAAAGEIELGLEIAVSLEQYWVTNAPREGSRRVRDLLDRALNPPPALHAQALRVIGGTTYIAADYEEGTRFHEQALAEFERLNDEPAVSHMLFRLAVEANRSGEPERAHALCEQARSLHSSTSGEAQVLSLLGDIAFAEGRGEEALDLLRESARLAGECGFRWWRHHSLGTLAEYALKLGKPEEARAPAGEALAGSFSIGDQQGVVYSLALLAWVATAVGDDVRAGRLWGSVEAESDRAPIGQWEGEREAFAAAIVTERPDFERGRSEGRRLSLEEAVEYALDSID